MAGNHRCLHNLRVCPPLPRQDLVRSEELALGDEEKSTE